MAYSSLSSQLHYAASMELWICWAFYYKYDAPRERWAALHSAVLCCILHLGLLDDPLAEVRTEELGRVQVHFPPQQFGEFLLYRVWSEGKAGRQSRDGSATFCPPYLESRQRLFQRRDATATVLPSVFGIMAKVVPAAGRCCHRSDSPVFGIKAKLSFSRTSRFFEL